MAGIGEILEAWPSLMAEGRERVLAVVRGAIKHNRPLLPLENVPTPIPHYLFTTEPIATFTPDACRLLSRRASEFDKITPSSLPGSSRYMRGPSGWLSWLKAPDYESGIPLKRYRGFKSRPLLYGAPLKRRAVFSFRLRLKLHQVRSLARRVGDAPRLRATLPLHAHGPVRLDAGRFAGALSAAEATMAKRATTAARWTRWRMAES